MLKILCHYFTGRTFAIKLNDYISRPYDMLISIPQGAILAGAFFICHFNQVFSCLDGVEYSIFVDDLAFWYASTDEKCIINHLQNNLSELDAWSTSKSMHINFTKTKMVIFHKPQNKVNNDLTINYNNHVIERVSNFTYLGIILNETMNFNTHLSHVIAKLSSAIGRINLIKKFLNDQIFIILLNCFVMSIVDYILPVWGHSVSSKLIVLQRKIDSLIKTYFYPSLGKLYTKKYWSLVNNKLNTNTNDHKNIVKLSKSIDINVLLEKCNILTINERLNYYSIITVYKTLKYKSVVPKMNDIFNLEKSRGTNQLLPVPSFVGSISKNSVHYQSVDLWNHLPRNIRDCDLNVMLPTVFVKNLLDWCMAPRSSSSTN
jgi:hypothetical protein